MFYETANFLFKMLVSPLIHCASVVGGLWPSAVGASPLVVHGPPNRHASSLPTAGETEMLASEECSMSGLRGASAHSPAARVLESSFEAASHAGCSGVTASSSLDAASVGDDDADASADVIEAVCCSCMQTVGSEDPIKHTTSNLFASSNPPTHSNEYENGGD
jgi:hypothetical protein